MSLFGPRPSDEEWEVWLTKNTELFHNKIEINLDHYLCSPPLKPEEDQFSVEFMWFPDTSEAKESKYGL